MHVFVLMPFNDDLNHVYYDVIKPALEEVGCEVDRADELNTQQSILRDIVQNIAKADLIVADLTGQNPNVLYELGIAHALQKPAVSLTQNINELPFDLKSYRVINYSNHYKDINALIADLHEIVQDHLQDKFKYGNPVSDYLTNAEIQKLLTVPKPDLPKYDLDGNEISEGYIDYLVNIEKTVEDLTQSILGVTEDTNLLMVNLNTHSTEIKIIQSNKGHGFSTRMQIVINKFANDLDTFATKLNNRTTEFQAGFTLLEESTSNFFKFVVIRGEEDKLSIKDLRDKMAEPRKVFADISEKIMNLHNVLPPIRNISRTLTKSTNNLQRSLQNFNDVIIKGEAYFARLVNLCDELLSSN